MKFERYPAIAHGISLVATSILTSGALAAQPSANGATSREIVQSLPTPEVVQLRDALQRLAKAPRDLDALVEAGQASLAVGDLDAALGFFGRALDLSPDHAGAKLGMASVYLNSYRPLDALRMFAEAEQAGASTEAMLGEWGLAQDLVGNNELAQQSYRTVLAEREDDAVRRRLALSLAISGKRGDFEATLLPLLQRQELSAHRTRAFGLAILGDTDAAGRLANQLMPPDLSSRMAPYLAYMPRLTAAQQAAAANLGIFPRAAQIGRDDPRIARYASSGELPAIDAGSRLVPQGRPLGEIAPASESRLAQVSRAQAEGAASVSEAFNGFATPARLAAGTSEGAVDITTIEAPREERAKAEPPPPAHPSRHWVQMATGRDRKALRFDWRRMQRKSPDLLGSHEAYVTRWGRANRLLTGPFPSRDAARELVNQLRRAGFDSFAYTSPKGEEIVELK